MFLWASFALIALIAVLLAGYYITRIIFGYNDRPSGENANDEILSELAEMKETLNSINKMLKDVQ